MKKGFTFAELMISLVIISVISAILYPTIADLAPNENAALFKSAYRSMSIAMSEVMNDTQDGVVPHATPTDLCEKMAAKLNVRENNCRAAAPESNTFTTSNGMRWYVSDTNTCTSVANSCQPIIIVDVASSNNDSGNNTANLPQTNDIPTLVGGYNVTAATTAFSDAFPNGATGGLVNDNKTQDTFIFGFNERGRMVGMDTAGYAHIEGITYSCTNGQKYNLDHRQCE